MSIKFLTHRAAQSADLALGVPPEWPMLEIPMREGELLTDGERASGWVVSSVEELAGLKSSLQQDYDAWIEARQLAGTYVLSKGEFFRRLTTDEWASIKAATRSAQTFEYLWDSLVLLDVGIHGPPDGQTKERQSSMVAMTAVASLFGEERARELFAPPA